MRKEKSREPRLPTFRRTVSKRTSQRISKNYRTTRHGRRRGDDSYLYLRTPLKQISSASRLKNSEKQAVHEALPPRQLQRALQRELSGKRSESERVKWDRAINYTTVSSYVASKELYIKSHVVDKPYFFKSKIKLSALRQGRYDTTKTCSYSSFLRAFRRTEMLRPVHSTARVERNLARRKVAPFIPGYETSANRIKGALASQWGCSRESEFAPFVLQTAPPYGALCCQGGELAGSQLWLVLRKRHGLAAIYFFSSIFLRVFFFFPAIFGKDGKFRSTSPGDL